MLAHSVRAPPGLEPARRDRSSDLRVIAAANESLAAAPDVSYFRRDLLYRLSGLTIVVPPLADRVEDIPEQLRHFLNVDAAGRSLRLLPEALRRLQSHVWPGNVRELKHVADRLIIVCEIPVVTERDVTRASGGSDCIAASNLACHFERQRLLEQLARNWNTARVAKESGVNRTTVATFRCPIVRR